MGESKILKGRCKKTGAQFGMELKEYGGEWKVVNMIKMEDAEADSILSEVKQPRFLTHTNLIPCQKCGSRVVGGCACAKVGTACTKNMKYKFACVYCNEFEINYSRKRTPYTEWAGVSNIPGTRKDSYGNPLGSEYDLAQDGAFEGYTIIVLGFCHDPIYNIDEPRKVLEKKGFTVIEYKTLPDINTFKNILKTKNSQLWVVADTKVFLTEDYVRAIVSYYEQGYGVYILSDNHPFYADSNVLLGRMFGTSMSGNRYGDNVLSAWRRAGETGFDPQHWIMTGIQNFYEGITISGVDNLSNGLKPLVYDSEGYVVTAYYDQNQRRVLVDGGYTRLYYKWDSAGTDRYVVNAAAWLANIERFGY